MNRRSGLVGLLAAEAISLTGTRLSMIALPWFVLTSTGSATRTGVVAACEMTPYVLSKALGGPLVDRLGPRRISVSADLVSAVAVGALPVLHTAGALHFGVLLALVGVTGAVRGPGDTAKRVLVPAVADAARVPLERATGLSGTVDRLADTVGPALAGVLVATLGPLPALALDAASFAVAAGLIGATAPAHRRADGAGAGYLADLRTGLAFVRRDRLIGAVAGMVAVSNLVDAAVISVLLPVWAKQTGGGPAALGAIIAALGVTAALGSMTAAAVGHRLPRRVTYLVSFIVAGAPRIAVLALDAPLWTVVAVWAVSGFGAGLVNPIIHALLFERTPRAILGRVSAVTGSLAWAGIPPAGPVAAGLLALAGLGPALLMLSLVYLVATMLPALGSAWREMDARRVPSPGTPRDDAPPPPASAGQAAGGPVREPAPH